MATKVDHPDSYPWNMVCKLKIHFDDGYTKVATGWLISADVVITVAHNLYEPLRKWANYISVSIGKGLISIDSRDFCCHPLYPDNQSLGKYDYGAIYLNQEINPYYFGIEEFTRPDFHQTILNFCGFSNYRNDDLFFSKGLLNNISSHYVSPTPDSGSGLSGAPVFVMRGNIMRVVAMHFGEQAFEPTSLIVGGDVFNNMLKLKNRTQVNFIKP